MVAHDPYFECKTDVLGKLGFSSYQKCTAASRMLAYGIPGDLVDEYVRMSETTCLMSMYKFCQAVIEVFGPEYLRQPTAADTERLLATNAARGFPGMLGSIDLYALGVEELSICLAGPAQGACQSVHCHIRSGGITRSLDMAFFFRHGRFSQ